MLMQILALEMVVIVKFALPKVGSDVQNNDANVSVFSVHLLSFDCCHLLGPN
jgi:hypothetical protein